MTYEEPQDDMTEPPVADEQEQGQSALTLGEIMQSPNLVDRLPESELATISHRVVEEYDIDKKSRQDWEERTAAALELAMMVAGEKNYPFENAANVKWPLLTVAALQFNARAYPAVVQGNNVAKCRTWGDDPQGIKAARAKRVSEHLSFQLLSEDQNWEEDTDKLLVMLPIVGCVFRKVYFDPAVQKNRTRLVTADRLVVNYYARSMNDVPRVTERLFLYPYEIQERIRGGFFAEFDYSNAESSDDAPKSDKVNTADADAPHLFLEQHRLLDLDEDGISEPYIVTVHAATAKVCRVVANFDAESVHVVNGQVSAIRKRDYYVKYPFFPSPDGGFYDWGLGWLLKDIGESINTTTNQLLDAGHVANIQGGLVSSRLGIKEKNIRLKMGEWRVIDTGGQPINQAIMPIKYDGPSPVLFQLLGMLIDAGKEVASIKDVLTGDTPATAPVGTTLAIIEQGLQVFTSIYKRVHRAIKVELGLHARLNRQYLDAGRYTQFFDGEQAFDPKQDYDEADMDVMPVSDPNSVSKMQRIAKAQVLKEIATENQTLDQVEVTKRLLEAAEIEDTEKLFLPPPEVNPEEEMLKRLMAGLAVKGQQIEIVEKFTKALKNVADAEAAEEGTQIGAMTAFLNALQAEQTAEAGQADGQGRVPGMEGQSGNAMGAEPAGAGFGPGGNGLEAAPLQPDAGAAPAMGVPATPGGL